MLLPKDNKDYGTIQYWQDRYTKDEGIFDWFGGYSPGLQAKLEALIPLGSSILHLGCGNSELGQEMYARYPNIVNLDYSEKVIALMRSRTAHLSQMKWIVGDIFELYNAVGDELFDVALDKGTLDALLTSKHDPWDPEVEIVENIEAYMKQVYDHLEPGGSFIHITFVQPHFRRRFLDKTFDRVVTHRLDSESGGFEYFIYEAFRN
jgi:EEF1A lysine methyltransferase 4